jgi:hypothetical protein
MRVEGQNLACFSGDSGGPFFIGTVALGILSSISSSGADPGECNYAVYMAINYASTLGGGISTLQG